MALTAEAKAEIVKQYQLEDGRVAIPEVLQPFMAGQKILEPCKF